MTKNRTNGEGWNTAGNSPGARCQWADRGASLVEYALLLALIAVVCVSALTFLGTTLDERIEGDAEHLQQAGS